MANSTKCLTSGAIFHTHIKDDEVVAKVSLPFDLSLNEDEAEILETLIHNSLEVILRPYFERSAAMKDGFKAKIRGVLDDNEALCMDNEDDKEKLFEAIVKSLSKSEWWEQSL